MVKNDDALTAVIPGEEVLACAILTFDSEREVSESLYLLTVAKRNL